MFRLMSLLDIYVHTSLEIVSTHLDYPYVVLASVRLPTSGIAKSRTRDHVALRYIMA
jgi:hypothetical protein